MMLVRRAFLLVALALTLAVAGCGGNDEGKPIPADAAAALNAELDTVQARIDNGSAGACRDILEGSRGPNDDRVQQLIANMPEDVDAEVRSALEDSFDSLWDLVQQDCEQKAAEEESQQQEQPEPEPTETQTDTETTPTETTPTETTPPAEEELPPEGDGDNGGGVQGNGNGNGVGNGGGAGPGGTNLEGGE
jgi:hypothetical protein